MALENVKKLIESKKDITVAYFGGSITEGAGASEDKYTWRARTTDFFSKKFPDIKFTEINAGIGGTGSDLGMFRIERDVLAYSPDLIFVEFAVNDSGNSFESAVCTTECVVRKILENNIDTDIIFIQTIQKTMYEKLRSGGRVESIDAENLVAEKYGIEVINVGETIAEKVDEGADFLEYTTDCCHPNDKGYEMYAKKISDRLDELFVCEARKTRLCERLSEKSFEKAELIDAFTLEGNFEKIEKSLCGRYPRYIEAKGNGEEISFSTDAEMLALYDMNSHDSGDIEWFIDGSSAGKVRLWDEYAKSFDRAHFMCLLYDIPKGMHKITIKAIGEKAEESEGTYIRIGAVLLAKRV